MRIRRPERYATLARVRKHQEEQKAHALAQARRVVGGLEEQRRELEAYQKRVLERAADHASEPIAGRMRALYLFERHLGRLADEKDLEIEAGTRDAEERRREFDEALKQRRIIERLIEKAQKGLQKRFRRSEQRHHDEIASIQFASDSLRLQRENEADRHAKDSRSSGSRHRMFSSGAHHPHGGDRSAR
ncbi:MAG: flagellar FliJ family protein [Candidatus Hydrogenedentes bacterium]|nr:flagellar FliJ family protein [Candidatus Hydrogenedentota bacterium]